MRYEFLVPLKTYRYHPIRHIRHTPPAFLNRSPCATLNRQQGSLRRVAPLEDQQISSEWVRVECRDWELSLTSRHVRNLSGRAIAGSAVARKKI